MEPTTTTNKLLTSVCRCCLGDGCFKDISTEYFWMGKREVYAEMLLDAFNVTILCSKQEDMSNTSYLICEQCITRLRDAAAFKQQVIQCEKMYKDRLVTGISENPLTSDPLEDMKKETDGNADDTKKVFEVAPDENDDDYDDADNQPLTNFSSSPKNDIRIVKTETLSKLTEKRPIKTVLTPPPIKRIKIPEMKIERVSSLSTLKRIMAKAPPPIKGQTRTMLDKKALNQQIISKLKKIGVMKSESNKSVSRQVPRSMVRQPNVSSKGPVKTLNVGGKIVVRKQIKPSTSDSKLAVPPRKENETSITDAGSTRLNAELIIKYSTTYPFKLPEENMVCVYCQQIVYVPSQYREHMKTNHPEVKLSGKSRFLNVQSVDVKVDITDLRCRICSEAFESLDTVALHLRDVHSHMLNLSFELGLQPYKFIGDLFKCTVCDQKLHTLRSLSRHTQAHFSKYPCETCGKRYSCKNNLNKHVADKHSSKKICCIRCKKTFDTYVARRQHLEESLYCRQYKCNVCSERFVSWSAKQTHLSKNHKDAQTFNCRECDESFTDKLKLRHHFHAIHDKRHTCQICVKSFRDKMQLRHHMLVHTKEKQFQCKVCEKYFSRPNVLNQHMVIHCEDRKLVCKVCGKKFNQRVTWKTHMKSYHPKFSDVESVK